MLAISEINALFSLGLFSHKFSIGFLFIIGIVIAISLVLYLVYFLLDDYARYIGGMIPLLLAALIMISISGVMIMRMK